MEKWLSILMVFIVILSGCEKGNANRTKLSTVHLEKQGSEKITGEKEDTDHLFVPLRLKEKDFQFIIGWISEESLLIIERNNGGSTISTYNIKSGKKKELYFSRQPVVSAEISPSKKYLFIHLSLSDNEAIVTIIRISDQQLVFYGEIESSEIDYEWNHYDETNILVNVFYKDWSFRTYVIDTNSGLLRELHLPQPFAIWHTDSHFLFLDWKKDEPDITASLVLKEDGMEKPVLTNKRFYYLDGWENIFLVISPSTDSFSQSVFQFYDESFHLISSFTIPHLSNYSGWEIPNYDFVDNNFIMIEPKSSGKVDSYAEGYQMVKRNIINGKKETIFKTIENTPLLCSPKGSYCLTGNLYENIVFIEDKKVSSFIKFE